MRWMPYIRASHLKNFDRPAEQAKAFLGQNAKRWHDS
jgi:hypothetical protein